MLFSKLQIYIYTYRCRFILIKLCILGWRHFPQDLWTVLQKTTFLSWEISFWVIVQRSFRDSQNSVCSFYCSWLFPWDWKEDFSAGDNTHFERRIWRNWAESDLEAFSPRTSSHNIKRCYSTCQGRKTIDSPVQLESLWIITMTSMAKYSQGCNSVT